MIKNWFFRIIGVAFPSTGNTIGIINEVNQKKYLWQKTKAKKLSLS